MVCPNCGEILPDGSKFCGNCGMELAAQTLEEETQPPAPPIRDEFPADEEAGDIVGIKKRPNVKKIVALCVVLAVIACVAVLFARNIFSAGSASNVVVSLSGGKYYLIKGPKSEPIELSSARGDSDISYTVSFSPDHRYVYYFTRVDESAFTGSLCRAEYKKIKPNSNKNERYIEVIASNVSMEILKFMDSGAVLYKNGDDTLYCFDGREATQIARNVRTFITEGSTIVYTTGNYDDGYAIYSTSLKSNGEKIKLASDFDSLYLFESANNIVYGKAGDEGAISLYLTGIGKETTKIASDARNIVSYSETDSIYFIDPDPGKTMPLYDFISDPDAAADSNPQEPSRDDFRAIVYSYQTPSLDGLGEDVYPELFTSLDVIQSGLQRDYGGVADEVWPLLQQFQDRFSDTLNADGYVPVTAEVRELLKSILTESGQDSVRWGYLCRVREGTRSSSYDYNAYYAAMENYNGSYARNERREKLKDRKNGIEVSSLYHVTPESGVVKILDNVVSVSSRGATLLCTMLPDNVAALEKLPFSRVFENEMSIYDVERWIIDEWSDSAESFLRGVAVNPDTTLSTPLTLSSKAADWIMDTGDAEFSLCVSGGRMFAMLTDETLWSASISGGTVGEFSQVAEDVYSVRVGDKSLYYVGNRYRNSDSLYGDFYTYRNGERVRIAQDILIDSSYRLYADGAATAYTSYRSGYGYELTIFYGNGSKTIVGDDVENYYRLSKSALLYLSEGDLRLYDGKSRAVVQENVERFWCMESMESALPYGYMSEYSYYYSHYN